MRSWLLGTLALALTAAACGTQEREPAPDQPASGRATFVPADGWNTVAKIAAVGEGTSPVAWAATVPFSPEDEGAGFPDATVAGLRNGEIAITALGPRPFAGEADFPQLADSPLVIGSEQCISRAFDGQPAPHITLCQLDRRVGQDWVLNVLVWLGAAGPEQIPHEVYLAEANAQLARLVMDD
jgi:hypothetical protein